VGGWKVLLGPALDGKGCRSRKQARDHKCDEKTRRDDQVRSSAGWKSNSHYDRCYANLESSKLAGGHPMRGVGQGEEVSSEGNRAKKREEVSHPNAYEEILPGGPRRRGKEA